MPSSRASDLPSRDDLLRSGGLFPIPLPLGWKLIDEAGKEVPLPAVPGDPFHRILARGALLATEAEPGRLSEAMTLRRYALPGAVSPAMVDQYVRFVLDHLAKQGVAPRLVSQQVADCALSDEPCGKIVFDRASPTDTRSEVHYLVRDRGQQAWQLVYLLRRENVSAWAPLFAELDAHRGATP
jgi:hypothetical protein